MAPSAPRGPDTIPTATSAGSDNQAHNWPELSRLLAIPTAQLEKAFQSQGREAIHNLFKQTLVSLRNQARTNAWHYDLPRHRQLNRAFEKFKKH